MQTSRETVTWLIICITIFILTFMAMIILIIFFYQRRQLAYVKKISTLKNEYDRNILNAQLEMQEHTMQNISREIHDHIGLSLTLAKLNLTTMENASAPEEKKIKMAVELITTAIQGLRNISHGLNADVISNNGLLKAIDEEVLRIHRTGNLSITAEVKGQTVFMDPQKELLVFRIIQEGLQNILKHAEADNARIFLDFGEQNLHLQIADDGKGFSSDDLQNDLGTGLLNIQARTRLIQGSCTIETGNTGTTLNLSIPF
jgi:signal transduction histidine kinase